MATGLKTWHRHWSLIGGGTVVQCPYCAEELRVQHAGLAFVHEADCRRPAGEAVHPWHDLAALLRELPAVPA
nr:hypothetical protein [Pseudomonas caspiana]